MRRFSAIVRATALEILSEPLSLLVLLAALALTVLAPAFHYHQFGEPTRMARDAGLSAVFTCGSVMAVFGTIRAFRREVESGTLEMALAHPISRGGFFLAKSSGALVAYLGFSLIVFLTSETIVEGAAIGGAIAAGTGDVAHVFGPCLAAGVGVLVLSLVIGAAVNRFAHCRFVLSCFASAAVLALLSGGYCIWLDASLFLSLLPAAVLLVFPAGVLLSAAAAFSVRLPANAAASAVGVVFLIMLPAAGNYYKANALSNGGRIPWSYVGLAALAALPALALFLLVGIRFAEGKR